MGGVKSVGRGRMSLSSPLNYNSKQHYVFYGEIWLKIDGVLANYNLLLNFHGWSHAFLGGVWMKRFNIVGRESIIHSLPLSFIEKVMEWRECTCMYWVVAVELEMLLQIRYDFKLSIDDTTHENCGNNRLRYRLDIGVSTQPWTRKSDAKVGSTADTMHVDNELFSLYHGLVRSFVSLMYRK